MGYQTTYCAVCGLEPIINGQNMIEKCLPIKHLKYMWLDKMIAVDPNGKKSDFLEHYGDGNKFKTLNKLKIYNVDGELNSDYYTEQYQPGILMHQNCYKLARDYFKDHIKKNVNLYTIFRPVFQMGLSLWNNYSDISDIYETKYAFTAKQIDQIYGKISDYWGQDAEYISYDQDEYMEPKITGIDLWYFSDPLLNYADSQKNKQRILGILHRLNQTLLARSSYSPTKKLTTRKIIFNDQKLKVNNKNRLLSFKKNKKNKR